MWSSFVIRNKIIIEFVVFNERYSEIELILWQRLIILIKWDIDCKWNRNLFSRFCHGSRWTTILQNSSVMNCLFYRGSESISKSFSHFITRMPIVKIPPIPFAFLVSTFALNYFASLYYAINTSFWKSLLSGITSISNWLSRWSKRIHSLDHFVVSRIIHHYAMYSEMISTDFQWIVFISFVLRDKFYCCLIFQNVCRWPLIRSAKSSRWTD
jgi:hypothetical protein